MNISGKVVLVTGSARGIGRRISERALAAGACVLGFDINPTTLDHPNFLAFVGDVVSEPSVAGAVNAAVERFGHIDALISNAGITGSGTVEQILLSDWSRVLNTNLTGAFLFAKHTIPHLKTSRGSIVNLSSTNGITGGSSLSGAAYACSKAGVIALTKHLAKELASSGVRVNAIAPGPVETEMIARFGPEGIEDLRESVPMKQLATVDDVADLVFFLLSDSARQITGVTVPLCGGLVM